MPKKFLFPNAKPKFESEWRVAQAAKRSDERWIAVSCLVRVPGIEPGSTAWEAVILPLNYTRICTMPKLVFGLGKHGSDTAWSLPGRELDQRTLNYTRRAA